MPQRSFNKVFIKRTWAAALVVSVMSVGVLANLMILQVEKREHYNTLAESNRLQFEAVAPPRGILYERNGRPLATNRTLYRLELTPSRVTDLDHTLARLQAIVTLDARELERFKRTVAKQPPFRSAVLKAHLTETELAKFAVDRHLFDGVEIIGELGRHYPYREAFAHAVGYTGLFSQQDLASINRRDYRGIRYIGKVGLEKQYEALLRGKSGVHTIEVNAQGRYIRSIDRRNPQAGRDLLLTLDRDLQLVAHEALADYEGAVVVMDPRDGDVLALVSKPAFDPNRFLYGFNAHDYQGLLASQRHHFFNRAVSGQYPPGSTIKPIIALAGLRDGTAAPDHYMFAAPHYVVPGNTRRFHDWKPAGHGWVNLRDSIAQSCDVYFYDLAYRTGIDRLHRTFDEFAMGYASGIDIGGEAVGLVPSREWKKSQLRQPWFPEETVITGIGQGYLLMTPVQLAAMTATIATRGVKVSPRLVRAVRDYERKHWQPRRAVTRGSVEFAPDHWQLVIDGMVDAVHRPNGTAYQVGADAHYIMAGKTGTVQTYGISEEERKQNIEVTEKALMDHALFIAFAPVESPTVVIAVVVEHVGGGAKFAAPIARRVLDAYFEPHTAGVGGRAATSG